jgi:hypothetical protein
MSALTQTEGTCHDTAATPRESGNGMRYMAPWILNISAYTD